MKMKTYHVVVEGDITTNMTAKEIREDPHVSVLSWGLNNERVTVKEVEAKNE